ncbi:protein kinase, putative [Plasmodium vinckei lentum]|uniref:Protein kinase, putative n=1 Tax=Plasmodium vinckei lentum TaxID=138297 RepID=A0A6V7SJR4_PLAVN|nr:protein kinase, putative [Plasmodium vinckei lentum]
MGILYSSKEKDTKYFHRGYLINSDANANNITKEYPCVFLKSGEKRLVKKIYKNVFKGEILNSLLKLRTYTYNNDSSLPKYLLKTYNLYGDDDFSYVIFENCTGGVFFDILKDNHVINENTLAEWFYQILIALNFLEKKNIYHGNLNGYCIYFKDKTRKEIRVSLLSVNSRYDNIDEKGDLYGLYFIRSPQEIKKLYHDKNNAWYVGMLLYFILHGSYPFVNNNVLTNYYNIIHNDIPFATLKSDHKYYTNLMYDFLKSALEKDYDKRLSVEGLLNHPWIKKKGEHPIREILDENTRKMGINHLKAIEQNMDIIYEFNNI